MDVQVKEEMAENLVPTISRAWKPSHGKYACLQESSEALMSSACLSDSDVQKCFVVQSLLSARSENI